MKDVSVFLMIFGLILLILGTFAPGAATQKEQVWLSQCAQHRPLQDCREDWNALKREQ